MKTIICTILITAAMWLSGVAASRAQDDPASGETAVKEQPNRVHQETVGRAGQRLNDAQPEEADPTQADALAHSSSGSPVYKERLQNVIRRSGSRGGKPLMIRSSEADPKDEENLEEDLQVMSHILE